MSVSGLILSMGGKTTDRAIKSFENQTVKCEEIIRVEKITTFYKAINKGISKGKTSLK